MSAAAGPATKEVAARAGRAAGVASSAQTNVALFNELIADGCSDADLELVRRAYDLAVATCSCAIQATGRPLLAHLVGTASILRALNAPPASVAAGLMHSLYYLGDFGDGKKTATPARRREVRNAVGPEVEDLVWRLAHSTWSDAAARAALDHVDVLDGVSRQVVEIRLADHLEHLLDDEPLYHGRRDRAASLARITRLSCEVADRLGLQLLKAALERADEDIAHHAIPEVLRGRASAFTLAPLSYGLRPTLLGRRAAREGVRRLRSSTKRGRRAPPLEVVSTKGRAAATRARPSARAALQVPAQTNIQLYNQLVADGWAEDDLQQVRRAYELALKTCTGRFNATGKPLIAHLVGTASILHSMGAPADVLAGGLVHNLYFQGDFGDGRHSITKARRERVRRAVGDMAEACAAGFATFEWPATLPDIEPRLAELDDISRAVILIHLADLADHLLDFEPLYHGDPQRWIAYGRIVPCAREMARSLGFAGLAAELDQRAGEIAAARIPTVLRGASRAYTLPPRSCRLRPTVAARATGTRLLTSLGRLPAAHRG